MKGIMPRSIKFSSKRKRDIHYLFLGLIFVSAFLLRFWHLQSIPTGLNQDESSIGYDAYSILKTGKDQHGKHMPLYFESFGDYKLPAYIYLTAVSEKVFGVNEFAVRFTSAVAGFLSVIIIYLLTFEISRKRKVALFASLLLAFNPWSLFLSRAGFEVNVASMFMMLGVLFFYMSLRKSLGWLFLIFSIISFGVSTYTYNVTRLAAPIILIMFVLIERKRLLAKFNKYFLGFAAFLFVAILSPFFFTFSQGSGFQAQKNVLIFGGDSFANLLNFRSALASWPPILVKILFNTPFLLAFQYVKNIIGSFGINFFFVSIDPNGNFGIPGTGAFYFVEILTITVGVIRILQGKVKSMYPVIGWFTALILIVGISAIVPRTTRSFTQIIPLIILSAYGLFCICEYLISLRKKKLKYLGLGVLSLSFIYGISYFLVSYFVIFPEFYSDSWRPGEKELSKFIMKQASDTDNIKFDKKVDFIYTSLLFYGKFSPEEFQNTVIWDDDTGVGFKRVKSFGTGSKYQFVDIDWGRDIKYPNSLLIMPLEFNENKVRPEMIVSGKSRIEVIPESGTFSSGNFTPLYFKVYNSNDFPKLPSDEQIP